MENINLKSEIVYISDNQILKNWNSTLLIINFQYQRGWLAVINTWHHLKGTDSWMTTFNFLRHVQFVCFVQMDQLLTIQFISIVKHTARCCWLANRTAELGEQYWTSVLNLAPTPQLKLLCDICTNNSKHQYHGTKCQPNKCVCKCVELFHVQIIHLMMLLQLDARQTNHKLVREKKMLQMQLRKFHTKSSVLWGLTAQKRNG